MYPTYQHVEQAPIYAPAQCSMHLHPQIFANAIRAPEPCPYPNGVCRCASSYRGYPQGAMNPPLTVDNIRNLGGYGYGAQNAPMYQYDQQQTPAHNGSSTRANTQSFGSDAQNWYEQRPFPPPPSYSSDARAPSLTPTSSKEAIDNLLAAIGMLMTTAEKLMDMENIRLSSSTFEDLHLEATTAPPTIVFIYDIEDITQLSWQNIEKVGQQFPDLADGSAALQDLLDFLADLFNWSDINGRLVMNIKEAILDEAIHEYTKIKKRSDLGGPIITYELLKKFGMTEEHCQLCQAVNKFQTMFYEPLKSAKKCLKAIFDKSLKHTYQNVVLSENPIGYLISQILLSGSTADVPLKNLYSMFRKSKETVLERIQRDFGEECLLVVVTSNLETTIAAEKLKISVWPVESKESFDDLNRVQLSYLLK